MKMPKVKGKPYRKPSGAPRHADIAVGLKNTDEYRDGWDRIFGNRCKGCGYTVSDASSCDVKCPKK